MTRCPSCNFDGDMEVINDWVNHCPKCGSFFGEEEPDEYDEEDDDEDDKDRDDY